MKLPRPPFRVSTIPAWSLLVPLVALALFLAIASFRPDGRLHLWVLDVGQGDALLLRTPEGHTALVDGGPGDTPLLDQVGRRLPFWQRSLDLVVVTHPHADHLQGLPELARRYRIGQTVQIEYTPTISLQREWASVLAEKRIPVHVAARGEKISFAGEPDVGLYVLAPERRTAANSGESAESNESSIVLRLAYGSHGILLEADAPQSEEAGMLAQGAPALASSVLKVSHHGSAAASGRDFLAAVRPLAALISVGAGNRYGEPSQAALDRLQSAGARVWRTDRNGAIEVIAGREELWIRSER